MVDMRKGSPSPPPEDDAEPDQPRGIAASLVRARSRQLDAVDGQDDDGDSEVLEGELVDPDDYDEDDEPRPPAVIEHGAYVVAGVSTVTRRMWDSRSLASYDRMMQAAQAVGDHATALEWEARKSAAQEARHGRRFDWIELPAKVIGFLPKAGIGCGGLLVVLGVLLAIATKDLAGVVAPIVFIADAVEFVIVVVSVTWLYVLIAAPVIAVLAFWTIGRRAAEDGDVDWLATSADVDQDIEIDERTIALALGALRVPQINAYLKQGLPLQFIVTARRDGRGTHAVLRLPAGVTAERIARRRADLATGLYRAAKEVWPTTGTEAGILDLWIADKGALAEGAGPYPLLNEGVVDVFQGLPFGKSLRGDPLLLPFIGRNTIVGGIPDQGKSSAARIIIAGAMLDPTVEIRIWVPDANYDFQTFERRCSRYVVGADPDKIEQILEDLRDLHAELQHRGELLIKYKEPEVTRELADMGVGLHPMVCLLEEAHVAITHKEFGQEIGDLLEEITKLDRKRGVHLIASTQAPTKKSMPPDVTRNCSNGIAFAVSDHVANDRLLGAGAYTGGFRATELIPGTDKGTALTRGLTGERYVLAQAYFLSVRKNKDQVTPLVERSLAEIESRGRAVPGTGRTQSTPPRRNLLVDIHAVLGEERVTVAHLAHQLQEHAPDWLAYKSLVGTKLAEQLRERFEVTGIKVITNSKGVTEIDPAAYRSALIALPPEDRGNGWEATPLPLENPS